MPDTVMNNNLSHWFYLMYSKSPVTLTLPNVACNLRVFSKKASELLWKCSLEFCFMTAGKWNSLFISLGLIASLLRKIFKIYKLVILDLHEKYYWNCGDFFMRITLKMITNIKWFKMWLCKSWWIKINICLPMYQYVNTHIFNP